MLKKVSDKERGRKAYFEEKRSMNNCLKGKKEKKGRDW